MRPSLSLAVLALVGNFAYGFSSIPRPLIVSRARTMPIMTPTKSAVVSPRGGAINGATNSESTPFKTAAAVWGTGGVVYILAKAIRRVLPIALEPFMGGESAPPPLSSIQLGVYIVTCLWFAYVEGYKGFQLKFAPLVVARSQSIQKWNHLVFAPLYSMGLVHATKKRLIVSWSVTLGVTAIVAVVKKLPYPWRNIVDAGVVAGLSWGSLSILALFVKSMWQGKSPDIDTELPTKKE